HIYVTYIPCSRKTFLLLKAFELANSSQKQQLTGLLNNKTISNADKVAEVTALYNTLGIKDIATHEANIHTDVALKHLDDIEADSLKKEHLKQFASQLLNRHT
ncbi:MAG: hypothetical protein V4506_06400, partial [Bacteroidota bacterium]